jgi:hypothetical protein
MHCVDVFALQVLSGEVGMTIIQAFLSRALNIAPHQLLFDTFILQQAANQAHVTQTHTN